MSLAIGLPFEVVGRFPDVGGNVEPTTVESIIFLHIGARANSISRSRCRRLVITFSRETVIDADAFIVQKRGAGFPTVTQNITVVGGKSVATLTFSGSHVEFASLENGNYELTILASKVEGLSADYSFGEVFADDFYVLYGDTNGDDVTNVDSGPDLTEFLACFPAVNPADPKYRDDLDFNNDGDIDGSDAPSNANRPVF